MLASNQSHGESAQRGEPIHLIGTIVDLIITVAALVAFNLFPDRIGIYGSAVDPSTFAPVLAPAFWAFLPWLNAIWAMALVISVVNLVLRRWTVPVHALDMARDLLTILVMALMIAGEPLALDPPLSLVARMVLAIALFAVLAELIGKVGHLMSGAHIARPKPA